MTVVFYIAAAVAVLATVRVVTGLNAFHSLLYLVVSLVAVSLVFYTMGAPFIAALEVIVYAGAIMVLFLFVIMTLNQGAQSVEQERGWLSGRMWLGPGMLMMVLLGELAWVLASAGTRSVGSVIESKSVGTVLFGPYVLGVELAGVLLLAGLIGACYLGRRDSSNRKDAGL